MLEELQGCATSHSPPWHPLHEDSSSVGASRRLEQPIPREVLGHDIAARLQRGRVTLPEGHYRKKHYAIQKTGST